MTKALKLRIAAAVVAVVGGGAATAASAHRETRIRIERVPTARLPQPPSLCAGAEAPLSIEIVPDVLISKGGRERIEYHVELGSRFETDAAVAWTAYLSDDQGHDLAKLSASQARVGAGAKVATEKLAPGALPDGNYVIRVNASLVSSDGQIALPALQPFVVAGGRISEISIDEWMTNTHLADLAPVAPGARLPPDEPALQWVRPAEPANDWVRPPSNAPLPTPAPAPVSK